MINHTILTTLCKNTETGFYLSMLPQNQQTTLFLCTASMVSCSWKNQHPMGGDRILCYIHTAAVVITGAEQAMECFLWVFDTCMFLVNRRCCINNNYCCFTPSPTCRWAASQS